MYTKYLILENYDGLNAIVIEKTRQGNVRKNVEYNSLYALLDHLNKYPRCVKSLKVKGNNLLFTTVDLIFELKNYKDFKKNENFSFVFKLLNNRTYKIVRNVAIKGTALGITSAMIISVVGNFISNANPPEQDLEYEKEVVEVQENIKTTEPYNNITTPNNSKEDKEEISTQVNENLNKNSDVKTAEEVTMYDELGIGSRSEDQKALRAKKLYYEKIKKYALKYGLDPDLVCAIATQERGIHSSVKDSGGAIGLMQIQVSVWHDKTIQVFDYEKNKTKTIYITQEKLEDIDFNIEVGCAVFQDCLNHMNGNVIAALQSYNTGPYAVDDIIRKYSKASGKSKHQILNENDLKWLDYRTSDYNGDPDYVEHVLRYFNGDITKLQTGYNNENKSIK